MPEIKNWVEANSQTGDKKSLWIQGAPGMGKTVLTADLYTWIGSKTPKPLVLYFFCKARTTGQNQSRDIVRALSYQIAAIDQNTATKLHDSLARTKREDNTDLMKFDDLFDKFVAEPSEWVGKEIYVLIDAVEEIESDLNETVVLIERLCKLPRAHVLVLSSYSPSNLASGLTDHDLTALFNSRSLTADDNREGIRKYVQATLNTAPDISKYAPADFVNIVVKQSSGSFLWVSLVMKQFVAMRGKREFRARYSEVLNLPPDDIAQMYEFSLKNLGGKPGKGPLAQPRDCDLGYGEKCWVKEAFMWVLGSRNPLSISEILSAIAFALEEEPDIEQLLRIKCGWFFTIARVPGTMESGVFLNHETVRTFIQSPEREDFQIKSNLLHGYLAMMSLRILLSDDVKVQPVKAYAGTNLVYHLENIETTEFDETILNDLHHLFESSALRIWVDREILHERSTGNPELTIEEKPLAVIYEYIKKPSHRPSGQPRRSLEWATSCQMEDLKDQVAKAAAYLWMWEELDSISTLCNAFYLSRKYYPTSQSPSFLNHKDEKARWRGYFAEIKAWAAPNRDTECRERNMGIVNLLVKQTDTGVTYLGEYTTRNPQDVEALEMLGNGYLEAGQHKDAESVFEKVFELKGKTIEARTKLASVYLMSGDRHHARDYLVVFGENCSDSNAWRVTGDIYRASGDLQHAVEAYSKSLYFQPWNLWAVGALAAVFRLRDEPTYSIEAAQNGVNITQDARALACLADAFKAEGRRLEALRYYRQSIRRNDTCIEAWKGLTDLFITERKFDAVIDLYLEETRKMNRPSWIWTGLGDGYRAKGLLEEAKKAYITATEHDSHDSWAFTCLADLHLSNGEFEMAITEFEKAIENNRLDAWPYKGLAEAYKGRNDYEDAEETYKKGIQEVPQDYSLPISIAQFNVQLLRFDDARAWFQDALFKCPKNSELKLAFLHLPSSPFMHEQVPSLILDSTTASHFFWFNYAKTLDDIHAVAQYNNIIYEYERALEAEETGEKNRYLWCYSAYIGSLGLDVFESKKSLPLYLLHVGIGIAAEMLGDYKKAISKFEVAKQWTGSDPWIARKLEEIRGTWSQRR